MEQNTSFKVTENHMDKRQVTVLEVRTRLEEMADEKYKEFHEKLVPGTTNILGIRLPMMRGLAKELAKQDWRDWFHKAEDFYYEETMVRGLLMASAKMPLEERFSYIREFVPYINNWAVCDSVCNTLKDAKKYPQEYWEFLDPYFHSENEYDLRFGTVMLLGYFVKEEYLEESLKKLDAVHHDGYYVKMAVAWALSVYFAAFPDRVLLYLREEHDLDAFTYKKTLQKILESYRVDKEMKQIIREMRGKNNGN